MPLVDGTLLRLRGLPGPLIKEYTDAAEGAWTEAFPELTDAGAVRAGRPSVALQMRMPLLDPQGVIAVLGLGGRFGTVEAANPAALREGLVRHLREWFPS